MFFLETIGIGVGLSMDVFEMCIRDRHTMCVDAWNWQRQNPDGYPENAGA